MVLQSNHPISFFLSHVKPTHTNTTLFKLADVGLWGSTSGHISTRDTRQRQVRMKWKTAAVEGRDPEEIPIPQQAKITCEII